MIDEQSTADETTDEAAPDIHVQTSGYGCTVAIGMILVFLGWCAWLAHLETMARYAARH